MKKESSNSQPKTPVYKKWWFWVIIVLVVLMIGASGSANNGKDSKEEQVQQTEEIAVNEQSAIDLFDEFEMETYCQEDHMNDIMGYFSGQKISVVDMLNYNKFFDAKYGTIEGDNEYKGQPYALLSWNGKNKTTGGTIGFTCVATKDKNGNKKLVYLNANGDYIRGSVTMLGD